MLETCESHEVVEVQKRLNNLVFQRIELAIIEREMDRENV